MPCPLRRVSLELSLAGDGRPNAYDLWVYPSAAPAPAGDVVILHRFR